ncbi:type I-G CRISPR-associated helicase/endonuclease Cas3g [Thalassoglobus polymorphus]|uniref:DEAD/DEAH box helicase n=1 Tax=Thalassoglobus polymorphus TaxID=2527994 RepID=A0A517QHM3_9PLAN|nr:type I-U CRISPR-associated helicase/endonuclease Cas3 [Thalassoglobus polymorphus]QDT31134.1 DEAD/DEAH box helicase [Thalassoglobus polymorphus]
MPSSIDFRETFATLTDHPPFPWQERLYERFLQNDIPETCLLPTGLGKTSVIAIWLIALANNPDLPRRLVYVVNRRTVVDQTTVEVEKIRKNLLNHPQLLGIFNEMCSLKLADEDNNQVPLAISTLRGQFADNQEWSQDPARPAVICGTIDMIGSRLLFSGYRCSFKTKPMQAGFLGQNSLLAHDEAHLEPAFQKLLEKIRAEQVNSTDQQPLRVMALSATARASDTAAFELDSDDHKNPVVKQRITAEKELHLHPVDNEKKDLIDTLTTLALNYQKTGKAVLVYARNVETVEKVSQNIEKELRKLKLKNTERFVATLTGTMRGLERNRLTETDVFKRFRPDVEAKELKDETVYLVCTSAGEVGVNISADHLICDLTSYESMAQRLGRVNRFGACNGTEVHVVHPTEFATEEETASKPELKYDLSRHRTLQLLKELNGSASPAALDALDKAAKHSAFSPPPEVLYTSDILFDAWANTTVRDLPGRPPVEEYLHGITDWEPPRTEVAWREEVERITPEILQQNKLTADDLLADYPLKPHEILSDRSERIFDRLKKIHERIEKDFHKEKDHAGKEFPPIPVWITNKDDKTEITDLLKIIEGDKKRFSPRLVLLPPKITDGQLTIKVGGLDKNGLFDASSETANDIADLWQNEEQTAGYHRRRIMGSEKPAGMRLIRSFQTSSEFSDQGLADHSDTPDENEMCFWNWYVSPNRGDDDGSKATVIEPIPWPQHTEQVIEYATQIGDSLLSTAPEIRHALILAARFHDFGKRRTVWQRSIGNPSPSVPYEKSGKAKNWGQLIESTRYRHEFGSLLNLLHPSEEDRQEFVTAYSEFVEMNEEQRDIVLHLIAVHHGRGRPHFPIDEVFDPKYSQKLSDEIAKEVPRRFARLQRRFGRWGLAWLESLFRSADYAASARPAPVRETTDNEVTA